MGGTCRKSTSNRLWGRIDLVHILFLFLSYTFPLFILFNSLTPSPPLSLQYSRLQDPRREASMSDDPILPTPISDELRCKLFLSKQTNTIFRSEDADSIFRNGVKASFDGWMPLSQTSLKECLSLTVTPFQAEIPILFRFEPRCGCRNDMTRDEVIRAQEILYVTQATHLVICTTQTNSQGHDIHLLQITRNMKFIPSSLKHNTSDTKIETEEKN